MSYFSAPLTTEKQQNTFRAEPSSNNENYKVFIIHRTSGYLYGDHEFNFSSRIKNANQEALVIDGEKDFYLRVQIATQKGEIVPDFIQYLPSALFKGCQENDYISFWLDDKFYELQLCQHAFPLTVAGILPQDNFERTMQSIRNNMVGKQYQFLKDNIIKEDASLALDSPRLQTNYPFFSNARFILRGTILIATANQIERQLTRAELKYIPHTESRSIETFKIRSLKFNDTDARNEESPNEICVEAPGLNLSDIQYFRCDNLLYVWGIRKETGGAGRKDTIPDSRGLEITNPDFFKQAPHFEISGTGLLFIRPSSPLNELQSSAVSCS
jgi:hypothetical protein